MRKSIPDFKTEEEELVFLETHNIEDYDDGPVEDVVWDIRTERKKRMTLRVEPSLIAELKELAEELDVPYQTLTRGLIKRGVREMQKAQ